MLKIIFLEGEKPTTDVALPVIDAAFGFAFWHCAWRVLPFSAGLVAPRFFCKPSFTRFSYLEESVTTLLTLLFSVFCGWPFVNQFAR
jgi:hypothetical protein